MSEWQYSAGDHPDDHAEDCRVIVPDRKRIFSNERYVPGADSRDAETMAGWCADDYYSNHDGWEASWPVEFRIYENGAEIGRFSVDIEMLPNFTASPLPDTRGRQE